MDLIIVTGLSGAGKSTVIRTMEDIGYFCIDNLPVRLIPSMACALIKEGQKQKVAVVSDVRAGINTADMESALSELKKNDIGYKILFIDCKNETLLNRFRLTRRTHPLMNAGCVSVVDAIESERSLMEPFRLKADFVVDTTLLSLNSCKNRIFDFFRETVDEKISGVKVHFVSFGFKYGVPEDADYIFDVRSLPNPYYVEELRQLTGVDERVSSFVMSFPEAVQFKEKLIDFCEYIVPLCTKDGRSQLVIAIGCTGGHHRSVTLTEILYNHFKNMSYDISFSHRDINK